MPPNKLNVVIRKRELKSDLAAFLHGALFSPVTSTLTKAIDNNHFISWPGLTTKLIKKHLPKSVATAKGHLNEERQHIQSTKPTNYNKTLTTIKSKFVQLKRELPEGTIVQDLIEKELSHDFFPPSPTPNIKSHDVVHAIVDTKDLIAYSDLTGKFPYRSSRGYQYLLVSYHYDGNHIRAEAIKNREATTLTAAWEKLNEYYSRAGIKPSTWVLDNEISSDVKAAFQKANVTYQLVPPKSHRANAAERGIQTIKNHFKAGLASVDPDFPIKEWDRLLPQANLTLNLLRAARTNPKLSAHAYIEGNFDYNKTPLAPPGTRVIAHDHPSTRATWAPNGEEGWTIGPSTEHYRCIRCYFPRTRSERNVKTVTFVPHYIPFPKVTTDDFLRQAAMDIIKILTSPPTTNIAPILKAGDDTRNTLLELAKTLQSTDKVPKEIPSFPKNNDKSNVTPTTAIIPCPRVQKPAPSTPKSVSPPRVPTTLREKSHMRIEDSQNQRSPCNLNWKQSDDIYHQQRYSLRPRRTITEIAQSLFLYPQIAHIFDEKGKRMTVDQLLSGKHGKTRWEPALSAEWGRLSQGNDAGVEFTDCIDFIFHSEVPKNKKTTYAGFACDYRPLKDQKWRVRIVVGGDKLPYEYDSGSPTTDLVESKILFNSTISDAHKGAKFCSMDLKDMFLHSIMVDPEFMKVPYKYFPPDIRARYNLDAKVHNGCIYIRIKKGMYGLKQGALLAYQTLSDLLLNEGYIPRFNWYVETQNKFNYFLFMC